MLTPDRSVFQKRIAEELAELRNQSVFIFLMCNAPLHPDRVPAAAEQGQHPRRLASRRQVQHHADRGDWTGGCRHQQRSIVGIHPKHYLVFSLSFMLLEIVLIDPILSYSQEV